jgi:hypothetical protein
MAEINTAKDVIAVARDRGFDVFVKSGPPPKPVLIIPAGADKRLATDALLAALRAWRLEIIEALRHELCQSWPLGV